MREKTPIGLVAALGANAALGLAAAGVVATRWLESGSFDAIALPSAISALVGLAVAASAARWMVAAASPRTVRTFRGSRTVRAYFAWFLWTALFAALSWRAVGELGLAAGFALAAITGRIALGNLDVLPRLFATDERLFGPGFPALSYAEVEAFDLDANAAPNMVCLRLRLRLREGTEVLDEWLAATEAQAVRRLLGSRGVKSAGEKLSPKAPRVPIL